MNKLTFVIIYYDWDFEIKFKTIETTSLKEGLEKCEEEINNNKIIIPYDSDKDLERILEILNIEDEYLTRYKTLLLMKEYLK